MPRDAQGQYSLPAGTLVSTGDRVLPSQHNPAMLDIGSALTESLPRDGRAPMRGPLNMSNYPIRNVGPGSAPTDAPNMSQLGGASAPVGAGMDFYGATAPEGWLFADGSAVSRADYAELFAVIGTTYGAGDGVTTFNLPDKRGRVTVGRDRQVSGSYADRLTSPRVDSRTLGASGGAQTVTLTTAEMPAHSHDLSLDAAGAHVHGSGTPRIGGPSGSYPTGSGLSSREGTGFRADVMPMSGNHTHTGTAESTGGGNAHNNVQPTLVCNHIIKARSF